MILLGPILMVLLARVCSLFLQKRANTTVLMAFAHLFARKKSEQTHFLFARNGKASKQSKLCLLALPFI
jgi:hypothetical protein